MPRSSKADAVVTPFPKGAAEPLAIPRYAVTLMSDAIKMAIKIRKPVVAAWNGEGRAVICPADEQADLPSDMSILGTTDSAGEHFHWSSPKPKR